MGLVKRVKQGWDFSRGLYAWVWYNTEFWIKDKANRRPYTFIIRDLYHDHPLLCVLFSLGYGYAIAIVPNATVRVVMIGFLCLLFAHLWWGSTHVYGEQENPPYNPND